MNTLVALGTLSAYFYSVWATVAGGYATYFDSVVMITQFVMLGRYIEMTGGARARKDVRGLMELQPRRALGTRRRWITRRVPRVAGQTGHDHHREAGRASPARRQGDRRHWACRRSPAHGRIGGRCQGGRGRALGRDAACRRRSDRAGRARHRLVAAFQHSRAGRAHARDPRACRATRRPGLALPDFGRADAGRRRRRWVGDRRLHAVARAHHRRRGVGGRMPVRAGSRDSACHQRGTRQLRARRRARAQWCGAGDCGPDRRRRSRQDRHGDPGQAGDRSNRRQQPR